MTILSAVTEHPPGAPRDITVAGGLAQAVVALVATTVVFFMITLDAVIVNVALPSMGTELGGGIGDLQWIVDGYTLTFAALLLTCGSLSDRLGAKRVLIWGMLLFLAASVACGLAPGMTVLIAARFVQGAAAAALMPSSMALLGNAYPDPIRRVRAVGIWATGGGIASVSGPVLGGLLSLSSWRLIFLVNIPVGLAGLHLITRSPAAPRREVPIDWAGQCTGILAMAGLTFGVIEAGEVGFAAPRVGIALTIAVAAAIAFVMIQRRAPHPMVPPQLFHTRDMGISVLVGFAFVFAYYGLPFVMSLDLQQHRELTPLGAGLVFLPMMLTGLLLTPFTARISVRVGRKPLIVAGMINMALGLGLLALLPTAPVWLVALLMILPGLAGPMVGPPVTAVLLDSAPAPLRGIASGVFNTGRQVGGALAVAVFGVLLTSVPFPGGQAASLLTAAAVSLSTAGVAMLLRRDPTAPLACRSSRT